MDNLNPFNRFSNIYTPPGIMVYSLIEVDGIEEFAFCIKEETKYIHRYKHPLIEVRIGMMETRNVLIVPMMVMVNNDVEMMYETMFNYYQPSGGSQFLNALQRQDNIKLLFYNERNEEARRIRINNNFHEDVQKLAKRLQVAKPWSMEEFDWAKEELYKAFPTGMDLWRAIDETNLRR